MNEHEAGRVLLMAISLDPKMPQPDEAGFIRKVWAAALHDVPIEVAQSAVIAHYRSDEYARHRETVSPADIVQWHNARRRPTDAERSGLNRVTRRELPAEAFDAQHLRAGVDRVRAALFGAAAVRSGEDPADAADVAEGEVSVTREVRSRSCSHCGARAGQPCVNHRGQRLSKSMAHGSRLTAAVVPARTAAEVAVAELASLPDRAADR